MSNAAAATTERKTFFKTVEVSVGEAESNLHKDRLVAVDRSIISTEAEKATAVSKFNDELKQKRKERIKLLDAISNGREQRDIECYQVADERLGTMFTRRVDTDQVIDERALTLEERQGKFPFKEGDKKPADGAEASATSGEAAGDDKATPEPAGSKVKRIKASDVPKAKAARKAKDKGPK